ncbi:hypothetical protein [Olivibacter ginsenosidimutans]|uniref:hypothetical protein n=1 Tax=Olivibacter ginsenosidimutans TaxID=1176537 RepID=UPI0031EC13EE
MERKTSLQRQYAAVLANPGQAKTDDIQQLLEAFPYSHALWFVAAKHAALHKDQHTLINRAALYNNPDQLYYYSYVASLNNTTTDQPDTVAKLDLLLEQHRKDTTPINSSDGAVTAHIENTDQGPEILSSPTEVLPTLSTNRSDREDLSKYDDELMPYSFVWWLHKTRLDYADTYRPYATTSKPPLKKLHNELNDLVLDQQIRENIFHLQSPEEKLNIQDSQTITFKIPHKTDEIIARFIKEEPQIKAPQANKITLENKAKQSAEDQSIFVSETLAQIYVEQGLYHKAIDAYMKLSLKYPKKSAYFADRIRDLESKIN